MQSSDFRSIVSPSMMAHGGGALSRAAGQFFRARQRFDEGGEVDGGSGPTEDSGGLGGQAASNAIGNAGAQMGGALAGSIGGPSSGGSGTTLGGTAGESGLSGQAALDAIGNAGGAIGGALAGSIAPGGPGMSAIGGDLGALNAAQGLTGNPIGKGGAQGWAASHMPGLIGSLLQTLIGSAVPFAGPALTVANLVSRGLTGQSLNGLMAEHGTNATAPNGTMAPGSDASAGYGYAPDAASTTAAPAATTAPAASTAISPWLQQSVYGVQSGSPVSPWRGSTQTPLGG